MIRACSMGVGWVGQWVGGHMGPRSGGWMKGGAGFKLQPQKTWGTQCQQQRAYARSDGRAMSHGCSCSGRRFEDRERGAATTNIQHWRGTRPHGPPGTHAIHRENLPMHTMEASPHSTSCALLLLAKDNKAQHSATAALRSQ